MHRQRTGGMTAIGILNIVFGSLWTVLSLVIVLGGGLVAAIGGTVATDTAVQEMEGGAEAGSLIAAGGGLLMLVGFASLVVAVLLLASGIGVLKLAPWGRTLSVFCGGVAVLLNGWTLVSSGFNIMTIGFVAYGGLLVFLFMQPAWKAAFSNVPASGHEFAANDNYRAAA